jgi:hypothetical protein
MVRCGYYAENSQGGQGRSKRPLRSVAAITMRDHSCSYREIKVEIWEAVRFEIHFESRASKCNRGDKNVSRVWVWMARRIVLPSFGMGKLGGGTGFWDKNRSWMLDILNEESIRYTSGYANEMMRSPKEWADKVNKKRIRPCLQVALHSKSGRKS